MSESIPLLDLQAQYHSIKNEIDEAVSEVIESQYFIMGPAVKNFEKNVAAYCEAENAFGCASGSDALLLALMAMDIQPGDEVITSPFTFFATAGAIHRLGAKPVFVDIEPDSFNIDPEKIEQYLNENNSEKVKAIIPVHLYGQMSDMDPIMDLAKNFELKVIEDAAQAIGSRYKGLQAGNCGDFGCFSFFPSKNLGAYGDAGLITVKDPDMAKKTGILRLHGANPKYYHSYVGINSRLDAIQAAILDVKLNYLDEWSEGRRNVALSYNKYFEEADLITTLANCFDESTSSCNIPDDKIILPVETTGSPDSGGKHIYHQYTIRVKNRDELINHLKDHKIGSSVYYPKPLHLQECFAELGYQKGDIPIAEQAAEQALSLPIYPELTAEQIKRVVSIISEYLIEI